MKRLRYLPHFRFPLPALPRLPLALVRASALLISARLAAVAMSSAVEGVSTQQVAEEKPARRSLLKRFPRLPARRQASPKKVRESEQVPQLSDIIDHNIETIISLHMHAELKVSRHQRLLERMTALLGRPPFFYLTLLLVAAWIALNLIDSALHLPVFDPAPFAWLQGIIGLCALLMTILVLTTQNRQAKFAERRKQLDLQVNLVVEHKVSKLIALVEELRRDMPMVRDRYDHEAAAMSEAVDPQAVFLAVDETLAEVEGDEESVIIQSDVTMNMQTSITQHSEASSERL